MKSNEKNWNGCISAVIQFLFKLSYFFEFNFALKVSFDFFPWKSRGELFKRPFLFYSLTEEGMRVKLPFTIYKKIFQLIKIILWFCIRMSYCVRLSYSKCSFIFINATIGLVKFPVKIIWKEFLLISKNLFSLRWCILCMEVDVCVVCAGCGSSFSSVNLLMSLLPLRPSGLTRCCRLVGVTIVDMSELSSIVDGFQRL